MHGLQRHHPRWPALLLFLALPLLAAHSGEAAAPPASLPEGTFIVVPARSDVRALVRSTLHDFEVEAKVAAGEAVIPPEAGRPICIVMEFRVREMDSGNSMRNDVMRSDVFEAEKFPAARFRSENVAYAGPGPDGALRFRAEGTLLMHGVEKRLSLPILVSAGPDGIRAEAQFPLRISDYGMTTPAPLPFLKTEDVVKVTARLVLRRSGE